MEECSEFVGSVCLSQYNIITWQSDYRRGLDWWLDLLTTITHDLWLHLIIAPSLISTLYKSLQHTLSLLSRSLVTASNRGDSSASAFTSLPASSQLHRLSLLFTDSLTTINSCSNYSPCIISARSEQKTPLPTVPLLLRVNSLPWEPVCFTVDT
jgi:hypothetical protein